MLGFGGETGQGQKKRSGNCLCGQFLGNTKIKGKGEKRDRKKRL
jgi:hypothetical protein